MTTKDNSVRYFNDKEICLTCKKLFPYIIGGDFIDLKKNGWSPRKDLNRVDITPPVKWNHPDDNACFNLHAWRFISASWASYIKNPTREMAQEVLDFNFKVMKDWHFNNNAYDSKFSWYDMSAAFRSFHLSFFITLKSSYSLSLEDGDNNVLDALVLDHVSWLSNHENITQGNHAIYEIIALRTLEHATKSTESLLFCNNQLDRLLKLAFDSNFVSTENSPFYHQYNIETLKKINLDIFPEMKLFIEQLISSGEKISKWLTIPSGEFFRIGDTEGKGPRITSEDLNYEDQAVVNSLQFCFKDLCESGYQVIRSHPDVDQKKSSAFIFRGGAKSNVHRHEDSLSFICIHEGIEVFSDPGKYVYTNNKDRAWLVSDVSHNTVGVHSNPLRPKHVSLSSSNLSPLLYDESCFTFFGSQRKTNNFHHSRSISFKPGSGFKIVDTVSNEEADDTELRFLLGPDVYLQEVSKGCFDIFLSNTSCSIARISFDPEPCAVSIIKKRDKKSFISREYNKKDYVDQLLATYSSAHSSINTDVFLYNIPLITKEQKNTEQKVAISSEIIKQRLYINIESLAEFSSGFAEYAFYIYIDGEIKYTRWYQDTSIYTKDLSVDELKKPVKVRGFVRDIRNPDLRLSSKIIPV